MVHGCSHCGMLYLADVPSQEEIDALYREYSSFKGLAARPASGSRLRLRLETERDPFISILENTGGIRGLSVCEIGCSHGGFLRRVRCKGGRPFGIELDGRARQSLSALGIPSAVRITAGQRFAVICFFQVLEHLVAPHQMMSCVSDALEPQGRIVFSVPNGGEYARIGPAWVGFRVDLEHLNYFDLRTLSTLLLPHGLYIEHYWEHAQPSLPACVVRHGTVGPVRRACGCLARAIRRRCFQNGIVRAGAFTLTVLARKV